MNTHTPEKPYALRPCTRIWLLLMALTGVTYLVGKFDLGGLQVSMAILVLALLKGQLVGDYFMGLRWVRGPWRWVVVLWLLVPGLLVGSAFYIAS